MTQYFATFPAGTFEILVKHLKSFTISEVKILENDSSSVLFESSLRTERLVDIRYFTNVYRVVLDDDSSTDLHFNGKFFRLMKIKNGEPSQIDELTRTKLTTKISGNFGLEPNSHLSRNDFYIIERASGSKLFTLCLPRAKFKREKTANGELRPELAHILCMVANLKPKHTMLDMFCGYSSIPIEAVRGFGCKNVIASDISYYKPSQVLSPIKWHTVDSRKLDFIENSSIDRIITDPPWGIFDQKLNDLATLYTETMKEMVRILKPDGIAVVLCGGTESTTFETDKNLNLIGKWNVLISGKKAVIYKLQKIR